MLTLNTAGKSQTEAVNQVRDSVSKSTENELKILIDGPIQAEVIKDYLVTQGFDNILPEDDEGTLYLMASRPEQQQEAEEPDEEIEINHETEHEAPQKVPEPAEKIITEKNSTGVLISCEAWKTNQAFYKTFLTSLIKAQAKPDVIALINNAVKLAAYNSQTCDYLKELEEDGVKILISEACSDRLGMTGAIGAGVIVDMSEIFDEIFACEKVISV